MLGWLAIGVVIAVLVVAWLVWVTLMVVDYDSELEKGDFDMTGTFVSLKNGTLTLSHGGNKRDTTHAVDPSASCTINGNAATLSNLEVGDEVSTSGDPVTSVSAKR